MKQHQRLLDTYASVLGSRMWINKTAHINIYHTFCKDHSVNVFSPMIYDLLSLLLLLNDKFKTPNTVMCYFSSVKTWVCSHNRQELAFHAYEIKLIKRAIFKHSEHIPKQAPPVTPQQFTAIIRFLTALNPPLRVLITALLVGYLTMSHQSNLGCHSINPSQNPHVLLYQDVKLTESALIITVRSTKMHRGEKTPTSGFRPYLGQVRPM